MEEDVVCKSSVCKETFCYFLSVVLRLNWGLGWLFVEVPRSHTLSVGILRTTDQLVAEAAIYTTHNKDRNSVHLSVFKPAIPLMKSVHGSPSHFRKIHFNITLPAMPGSSKWPLSLRFLHQNHVHTIPPPYMLHAQPISFFAIWSPR